ncbi:MAG: hypothetical protein WDO73_24090 [Ignavibacteriota bacterium]
MSRQEAEYSRVNQYGIVARGVSGQKFLHRLTAVSKLLKQCVHPERAYSGVSLDDIDRRDDAVRGLSQCGIKLAQLIIGIPAAQAEFRTLPVRPKIAIR